MDQDQAERLARATARLGRAHLNLTERGNELEADLPLTGDVREIAEEFLAAETEHFRAKTGLL